jgi:FkbM family methyltransferase
MLLRKLGFLSNMKTILRTILRNINFKGKRRVIKFFFKDYHFKGVVFSNGYLMDIDTKFLIDWEIYWMGGYERDVLLLLDKFIKKEFTCIDIGANIGIYTLPLAGKSNKVIAVEPCFAPLLRKNLILNKLEVEIKEIFLSDQIKEADVFSFSLDNNTRTIIPFFSALIKGSRVKVSTLDEEFKNKVDFIKIDTDGADPSIVLGGKNIIKKYHPIILFEICGSRTRDYERALNEAIEFLRGQNYSLSLIHKGRLLPFVFPDAGWEVNVLALPANNSRRKQDK